MKLAYIHTSLDLFQVIKFFRVRKCSIERFIIDTNITSIHTSSVIFFHHALYDIRRKHSYPKKITSNLRDEGIL